MMNFILLILSAITVGVTMRGLKDGLYNTSLSANIYLFGGLISWSGVVIALLRIFNVQ